MNTLRRLSMMTIFSIATSVSVQALAVPNMTAHQSASSTSDGPAVSHVTAKKEDSTKITNVMATSGTASMGAGDIIAPQRLSFSNGDTLTVKLSTMNTNRLTIDHDQLSGVVCPPQDCAVTKPAIDPSHSAYINVNADVTAPFTVPVSTQAGRYFSLFVIPQKIPGVSLIFEPQSAGPSQDTLRADAWVHQLSTLMKGMVTGHPPDGFGTLRLQGKATPMMRFKKPSMVLMPIIVYRGAELTGTVYRLLNTSHHAANL